MSKVDDIPRLPEDGNRTDDVAMLSTPVWFEHGNPGENTPAFGFDIELWFAKDMAYDDKLLNRMSDWLDRKYNLEGPYWCTFEYMDWYQDENKLRVPIRVEFAHSDGYLPGESTGEFIDRVVANTPFMTIYNRYILYNHGAQDVAHGLRMSLSEDDIITTKETE